jgi:uncharacterized protein (DUF2235 family)
MRYLIWFSDGTGNKPTTWTNVYWLYALAKVAKRDDMVCGYDAGVGTWLGRIPAVLGLGFGAGFAKNIRDGYRFFSENYHNGDKLYLFGFSRGAYNARSLANFIDFSGGLLGTPRSKLRRWWQMQLLYNVYRWRGLLPNRLVNNVLDRLTKYAGRRSIAIEVLGVWETVGSVGLPLKWHWYHQVGLASNTRKALHALALDEKRKFYAPVLFAAKESEGQSGGGREGQIVKEVWFAGVHSDVGGGYEQDVQKKLPHLSLAWVLSQLPEDFPLKMDLVGNVDPMGIPHKNPKVWSVLGGLTPREVKLGSSIHMSVVEKCLAEAAEEVEAYAPAPKDVTKDALEKSLAGSGPFVIEGSRSQGV